jgi:hypothetical protein
VTIVETERVSAPPKIGEDAREERERGALVLEAAALEIEVRGHAKQRFMDESGAVCAGGALACARGWDGTESFKLWDTLLKDRESLFPGYWRVPEFNNATATTPEQVTFLLRWRAEEIRDGR